MDHGTIGLCALWGSYVNCHLNGGQEKQGKQASQLVNQTGIQVGKCPLFLPQSTVT
jgi:hypothetical protein